MGQGTTMTKQTHFAFRIDHWTDDGESIVEQLPAQFPGSDGDLPCCPQALAQSGNDLAGGHARD